jgi:hypothetical protein
MGDNRMHFIQTISTKTLRQTAAGELIKLRVPAGNHFAIVLDYDPKGDRGPVVGFLEPTGETTYPSFRRLGTDHKCLSYGFDWVVDLVGNDESWACNRSHLTSAGALLVDAHAVWLSLQPSSEDHWGRESYFDLRASKFTDKHPEDFTPFLQWRIWQNKEDFLRTGTKPLIEVNAVVGR